MRVRFIGASDDHVTGSCTHFSYDRKEVQFLVDCGLHQGENHALFKNRQKFPFDAAITFLPIQEQAIFQDLITYQELDLAEKAVPIISKDLEKQVNVGLYLAEKGKRYLPLFASFSKLPNESKIEVLARYPELVFRYSRF